MTRELLNPYLDGVVKAFKGEVDRADYNMANNKQMTGME